MLITAHAAFIADRLAAITLNRKIFLRYVHQEKPTGRISAEYAGKYMMEIPRPPYMAVFTVELVRKDDTLYIHPSIGSDTRLNRESTNKYFFADNTDQQKEFEAGTEGRPMRVWQIAWGFRKELRRIEYLKRCNK